jgi:hypothetical protein
MPTAIAKAAANPAVWARSRELAISPTKAQQTPPLRFRPKAALDQYSCAKGVRVEPTPDASEGDQTILDSRIPGYDSEDADRDE